MELLTMPNGRWSGAARARGSLLRAALALGLVGSGLAIASSAPAASATRARSDEAIAKLRDGHFVRQLRARRSHASLSARAAIVGGSEVEIAKAPWEVAVFFEYEGGSFWCSGSIIDLTHILTAGHCAFNENALEEDREVVLSPSDYLVVAGTSNITKAGIENTPTVQTDSVLEVHPHPYYREGGPSDADDVAVLTLSAPLSESAAVRPIGLAERGLIPANGAAVALTGFGEENDSPKEQDDMLHGITMTLNRRDCEGEADAVRLCASTPSGSVCHGDSGSALTLPGSPATEIGVTDTVEVIDKVACTAGAIGGFANVAAPEIGDFIEGELTGDVGEAEEPPHAPRGGRGIVVHGVPVVGYDLTCEQGVWQYGPTFTYSFIDSYSGAVLQEGGSDTYALTDADVARTIACHVQASNSGGTGEVETEALPAITTPYAGHGLIEPVPVNAQIEAEGHAHPPWATKPQASLPATTPRPGELALAASAISVRAGGVALVKVRCAGVAACHGKLTLEVAKTTRIKGRWMTVTIKLGTGSASLNADQVATIGIRLSASGRALLKAGGGRLAARATILQLQPSTAGAQTAGVRLTELAKPPTRRG